MITKKDHYAEWALLMYELDDAKEHLETLMREMTENADFAEEDYRIMEVTIGGDGRVASAQVLRSSGYSALDESAVKAVRLWRAHNKFAGKQGVFPIHFEMGRRRH